MNIETKANQGSAGYWRWEIRDTDTDKILCSSTRRFNTEKDAIEQLEAMKLCIVKPLKETLRKTRDLLNDQDLKIEELKNLERNATAVATFEFDRANRWQKSAFVGILVLGAVAVCLAFALFHGC